MPAKKKKKAPRSKDAALITKPKVVRDAQRFNMEVTAADIKAFKAAAKTAGQSMSAWARQTLRKAALP